MTRYVHCSGDPTAVPGPGGLSWATSSPRDGHSGKVVRGPVTASPFKCPPCRSYDGGVTDDAIPLTGSCDAPWPVTNLHRGTWLRWLSGIPQAVDAIAGLPAQLDYDAVVRRVAGLLPDVVGAFATVLAWSYGSNGRGAYKTAQVLTGRVKPAGAPLDSSVAERLTVSLRVLREDGPLAAYDYLTGPGKIWKLGPAFFTKWLYCVSVAEGLGMAPILDSVVTDWLAAQDPGVRLDYTRSRDYARYIRLLETWAGELGLALGDVAGRVFRLSRACLAR